MFVARDRSKWNQKHQVIWPRFPLPTWESLWCYLEWLEYFDRCNHRCFLGGAGEWAWEKFSASEMHILEKKMAIHSSILAWKILWPEEPGGLPGASTRDPTHDKVMREKTWRARPIRFSRIPKRLAHEIPPMTRSWGESLTGKADQVFRYSEKLPQSCPRRSP